MNSSGVISVIKDKNLTNTYLAAVVAIREEHHRIIVRLQKTHSTANSGAFSFSGSEIFHAGFCSVFVFSSFLTLLFILLNQKHV